MEKKFRIVEKKLKNGNSVFRAEYCVHHEGYTTQDGLANVPAHDAWYLCGIDNLKTIKEAKQQIEIYKNNRVIDIVYHNID